MVKKKSKKIVAEEKLHNPREEDVYPEEEQGILPEETPEEKETKMKAGEEDEDIYSKEGRELQADDDEIEPWEEGFVEGAHDAGQLGKDALTGEPLMDVENVVEAEIEGKTYRFVDEKNARIFREKRARLRKVRVS